MTVEGSKLRNLQRQERHPLMWKIIQGGCGNGHWNGSCYKRSKEIGPKENWLNSNWMLPSEGSD